MSSRLQITLSAEATKRYLEVCSARTKSELEGDCEPSGTTILLDVGHIHTSVMVERGHNRWIDIGEARVELLESVPGFKTGLHSNP